MRAIGNIEHPYLKITVFKSDERLSVKFENEGYEIGFKLGMDDRLNTLEAVRHWVDQALANDVLLHLQGLHRSRLAAGSRAFPEPQAGPEFEEII